MVANFMNTLYEKVTLHFRDLDSLKMSPLLYPDLERRSIKQGFYFNVGISKKVNEHLIWNAAHVKNFITESYDIKMSNTGDFALG